MKNKKNFFLLVVFILSIGTIQAQWTQTGNTINGENNDDWFGISVSLSSDGSTLAVGAARNDDGGENAGHVRVFNNVGGTWTQIGSDLDGASSEDWYGYSVCLSSDGSILAVGARKNDAAGNENSGRIYIYENQAGTWTQIQTLFGLTANEEFGVSISLSADGTIFAIGSPFDNNANGTNAGKVRIYKKLTNVTMLIGEIYGEAAGDESGRSVSLSADGNTLAIGAVYNDGSATDAGHVRIYHYDGTNWLQIGDDIDGAATDDFFGYSVSLSSDASTVAIGAAHNDDVGIDAGSVYIYENQSDAWVQIGSDINGEAALDNFGVSVSLNDNGSIVAIGAYKNDNDGGASAGSVQIFENQDGTWTQLGANINGAASMDNAGSSVCLDASGSIVAIGSPYLFTADFSAGSARVFSYTPVNVESLQQKNILIYPNPSTGIYKINTKKKYKVTITDISGKIIKQFFTGKDESEIDISDNAVGLYFVIFQDKDFVETTKIIKK